MPVEARLQLEDLFPIPLAQVRMTRQHVIDDRFHRPFIVLGNTAHMHGDREFLALDESPLNARQLLV